MSKRDRIARWMKSAEGIKTLLEWVLKDYPQATVLTVNFTRRHLVHRQLVIEVSIGRTYMEGFGEALGAIHGAIAEIHPKVTEVVINDVSGQQITWQMSEVLGFYRGQTTLQEFRKTWKVSNPSGGSNA